MKRKFKLITSVASLAVAISLMMLGVAAAVERTVPVTGTVTFTATQVSATVSIYQAYGPNVLTDIDEKNIVIEGIEFVAGLQQTPVNESIKVGEGFQLSDEQPEKLSYTYWFKITNDFEETGSSITATINVTGTMPAGVTREPQGKITIAPGVTETIKITFSVNIAETATGTPIDLSSTLVLEIANSQS